MRQDALADHGGGGQAGAARAAMAAGLRVGALDCVADRSGALFVERHRLLAVADLHLEKGSSFAARGALLPPYDSRQTLMALAAAITRFDPAMVVVLGDTLHDRGAFDRLGSDERALIAGLQAGRDWLWLTGNHDPALPLALGGSVHAELTFDGVAFRHIPTCGGTGPELAGHLHPAARVFGRGRTLRRRCFITDGHRCVLPAFGAYAGGLNVLDRAFAPLFPGRGFTAHVLGTDRVYAVDPARLASD